MSEKACKTPLTDLLRSVPADTRLVIERSSFAHDLIPVGRLCNEAAAELARLRAELAARDAAAVDAIAQAYEDGRISACNAGKPGCPRVAALEAECAPFLKDGETPAECIARWRAEAVAILELLRQERVRSEKAEAELAARDASKPKEPKS